MHDKPIKMTGAVENIIKNKQQELENSLSLNIQQIFIKEQKLNNCLHFMLLAISEYMNADVAELWMPNYDNSEFNHFSKYVRNGSVSETPEKIKYIEGKGLIGKMWEAKKSIVLDDLQSNDIFLRQEFAKENKLNSAAAVPVIFDDKVIAGLCFFSQSKLTSTWFNEFSNEFLGKLAWDIQRKKKEDEYERFFNVSPDILCICGLDGYFKKISPAAVKILGYSIQELMSRPFYDFMLPGDRKESKKELEKLRTGKSSNYNEKRFITKGGDVKLLSWTFELQADEGLVYAVGRDITERRIMKKMIEAEQNRFTKMFVEAPVSMCILKGKNHVFTAANNQYYRLTGRSKHIIGKTVREVFPEVAGQGYYEWLDQVFNTGETFSSNETPLNLDITGDGTLTDQYISFMYQPFHNEAGEVEGIFYFGVDVTEQVLARKRVEESEERFRVIFEQAAAGVAMVETKTGKLVRVNGKYCEIFGYTADELSKMTFMEFSHPEDLPNDLTNMKKLVDGEISEFTMEKRHFKKDGAVIWISLSVSPMWKKGMQPIHHIAIIQDITEKKKAAEILTDSEKKYVDLIADLPVAIYTTDTAGNIVLYNKAAEHLWGKKPVDGKDFWCGSLEMYDADGNIIPHRHSALSQAIRGGIPMRGKEFFIKRPNGDKRQVIPYPSVILNSQKVITGGVNVLVDVTELKEAEAELEKLSLIAKKTVNPVIITTLDRKIEWVNDAFTKVTGYSFEEAVGRKMEDMFHGESTSPVLKKYIEEQITLKESFECEIIKYNKQGEPFWVESKGQTLLNRQGEVTHYFLIETDITERKLAFKELEEKEIKIRKFAKQLNLVLEEERTRIAREIHDEFGQQLSGLKMSLASLARSVNLNENKIIHEILLGVENSIHSLRKISTELRPSILDTMGLIPSLEWLMTEFQKKSGITCICNIQPGIKPLDKNTSTCIFRICQEALTNISKHAGATLVTLNISVSESQLVFTICDDGIGFDSSKMYKPFSMGILGMQERANLIGADFEISGNPDNGTCVTIKLVNLSS